MGRSHRRHKSRKRNGSPEVDRLVSIEKKLSRLIDVMQNEVRSAREGHFSPRSPDSEEYLSDSNPLPVELAQSAPSGPSNASGVFVLTGPVYAVHRRRVRHDPFSLLEDSMSSLLQFW